MGTDASAREAHRTRDGRFGAQHRAEVETDLAATDATSAESQDLPVSHGHTVGTWDEVDEGAYFLRNLITDHAHRGQGSARAFMDHSIEIADARGLRLDTVPGNPGLQRWYESLGFVVDPDERGIGHRPYMTRKPEQAR